MNYVEVAVEIIPRDPWADILMAELGDLTYESFQENEFGFKAYTTTNKFNADTLTSILDQHKDAVEISYTTQEIKEENWNELWESNFQPIEVENKCLVRAPFHPEQEGFEYEVIIQPQMSFGTGHHATTWLMLRQMFEIDIKQKRVLDMGAGTGILGILASKMGASQVRCVDIDEWSVRNCKENMELNHVDSMVVDKGNANVLDDTTYNIIFANINRNVLLEDLPTYSKALKPGGNLLLSGFYFDDSQLIKQMAANLGLIIASEMEKDDWALLHLVTKH